MSQLIIGSSKDKGQRLYGVTVATNDGSEGDTERWSLIILTGNRATQVKWCVPLDRFEHKPRVYGFTWAKSDGLAKFWNWNPEG